MSGYARDLYRFCTLWSQMGNIHALTYAYEYRLPGPGSRVNQFPVPELREENRVAYSLRRQA